MSRSLLRALLIVFASTTLALGQQVTQVPHDPTAGVHSGPSEDLYSQLLQQLRATEARFATAEERLSEHEERWRLVGSSAGDDGMVLVPGQVKLSGPYLEQRSPIAQCAGFEDGHRQCPCLPPYCDRCLTRLSWNKMGYRITAFGSLAGEAILTDSSTTVRAFIRYVNPDTGLDDSQSTITGQGSAFGLNIEAPRIGGFEARGLFYFKFYV